MQPNLCFGPSQHAIVTKGSRADSSLLQTRISWGPWANASRETGCRKTNHTGAPQCCPRWSMTLHI